MMASRVHCVWGRLAGDDMMSNNRGKRGTSASCSSGTNASLATLCAPTSNREAVQSADTTSVLSAKDNYASLDILSDELWERVARHVRPADLPSFGRTCRRARRAYRAVIERRRKLFVPRPVADAALECRSAEPLTDLKLALRLPDTAEWTGHYAQATLSPMDGQFVVRVYVRCCQDCNPSLDFSPGAAIGAGAELWDTRTATRRDIIHFTVKYPGEKRVDLRWTRHDRLCVIVGEASHDNDAPQIYTIEITRAGTLRLASRLYVNVDLPDVDLFDKNNDLERPLTAPLPQVVRVHNDTFAGSLDQSEETRISSTSKVIVCDSRVDLHEPLGVQTSMDGRVVLISETGRDFATTYALDSLADADDGPIVGMQPEKTAPLAIFPSRRDNALCFLSPCGNYVAVVTTIFKSDDLQKGYTEQISVTMYRSNCSIPLYTTSFSFPITGDFRPGQPRCTASCRGAYSESFFGDGSDSKSDTFVVPMNNEDLPIILVVETGEAIRVPDLGERSFESLVSRPETELYRFSLNESLFLTFFSSQGGNGYGVIRVYDCISYPKLVCTLETPSFHRWRCEAHPSGLVLLENNCSCCLSCVLIPSRHILNDASNDVSSTD